jgi:group II intron reverse transcriptase/maturase
MQDRERAVQTSLQGIAKKAAEQKKYRFRNLYTMLNEKLLLDSWHLIRKDAAYGVDRVSAWEYEQNLGENIRDLVERLKRKGYRAKLVRRQYIPKGDGGKRPLGIPATEDKLLQLAVKQILEAIYEPDFLKCSYGYRPKVGAREAVHDLTVKLQFGSYHYVVEADIQDFFEHVDHEWMIRMLQERIDDRALLRLVQKWLKAGVLEKDGKVMHPATGTPQGGVISPVLANIYLHYVLDLWFQEVVKKRCRGEACLIRYADDFVAAFEDPEDAEQFHQALPERLEKFGLELSAAKTRVIPFHRDPPSGGSRFEFLGFEFYWDKDRKGRPHLKRRTARKRLWASLVRFAQWCRAVRHLELRELIRVLNAKLRGYYNYYGVVGNYESLDTFFRHALRILFDWLNRRRQRPSYTWPGFVALLEHNQVEKPRIVWPSGRRATSALPAGLRKRVSLKSPVR